jgi:hypothetical protein
LISDGAIVFNDSGVHADFHGVEQSSEVRVVLDVLLATLWENKGDGVDIHGEGDSMVRRRFDSSRGFRNTKGELDFIVNDVSLLGVELGSVG